MAEDMIGRAAQANKDIQGPPFGTPEWLAKHGEKLLARQQRAAEQFARAALLAALDPEDEALVLVTAKAMLGFAYPGTTMDMTTESNRVYFLARAHEAIVAIRAHAQGER